MEEVNLDRSRCTTIYDSKLALKITDAYKSYSADAVILNGFNMNVEKGTIYGLLGPSGCGKTTLLSCIIGRCKLNSGHIKLSTKKKKEIGYMPQELALYDEFNILETLHYFGSLYKMSYKDIRDKGKKLLSILELPSVETQFGSMSGGQKRRFSMCTALLHDPSLLILDEPTVGLDPIISASIWTYLKSLANSGKTIIITTHYIEEARLANMIGLMRKGILLSEAPPQQIMDSCNAETLEKAFLILSQKQTTNNTTIMVEENTKSTLPATTTLEKSSFFSPKRFKAQLLKHWYWSKRNWTIILFVILLPIFTLLVYNLTLGLTPQPLNIGVINNEIPSHCSYMPFDICDENIPLSCKFMHEMEKHELTLKNYNDLDLARKDLSINSIWGYVKFQKNFTNAIKTKFEDPTSMNSDDISDSFISSSLDMSNFIVSTLIQGKLVKSYKSLSERFTNNCNKSSSLITTVKTVPIRTMDPIFGSSEVNVAHYGSAAVISILELYLTFLFTSLAINMEKNSGMIDRSLASGLTIAEIMISQLVVQIIILVVQTILVFALQFVVFKHPFLCGWTGPLVLVFLQGICGTFLGLAACVMFDEKITTFLGVFMVMSQVFLSGIMWPIEAMHPILKKCSYFLPLTLSVDAFRSMTSRNWGISNSAVSRGFVSIVIWIFAAILIMILSLKIQHGIKQKK